MNVGKEHRPKTPRRGNIIERKLDETLTSAHRCPSLRGEVEPGYLAGETGGGGVVELKLREGAHKEHEISNGDHVQHLALWP